jgi:hypothetical protein
MKESISLKKLKERWFKALNSNAIGLDLTGIRLKNQDVRIFLYENRLTINIKGETLYFKSISCNELKLGHCLNSKTVMGEINLDGGTITLFTVNQYLYSLSHDLDLSDLITCTLSHEYIHKAIYKIEGIKVSGKFDNYCRNRRYRNFSMIRLILEQDGLV